MRLTTRNPRGWVIEPVVRIMLMTAFRILTTAAGHAISEGNNCCAQRRPLTRSRPSCAPTDFFSKSTTITHCDRRRVTVNVVPRRKTSPVHWLPTKNGTISITHFVDPRSGHMCFLCVVHFFQNRLTACSSVQTY